MGSSETDIAKRRSNPPAAIMLLAAPGSPLAWLRRRLAKRLNRLRTRWRHWRQPATIRLGGVVIPINRDLFSDKIIRRLYDGGYEKEEREALARTLQLDDRLLELGAGIGYLSAFAARRIGGARVTACEANADLLPVIATVHRRNGVSPAVRHGVMMRSPTASSQRFYIHRKNFWSSSLHRPDGAYDVVDVPALDWIAELAVQQPSYLVMDIEGGEIELLADFDWPSVRRILVEFHPKKTDEAAVARVFEQLSCVGFKAVRVDPGAHIFYFER